MNTQRLIERQALKDLVDTFSNLADEKRVAEQMPLFAEDAQVTTYIGSQLFADMKGRAKIKKVFSNFLANFHTVYHLNGQHTVIFTSETTAEAIDYCMVKLVGEQDGKQVLHDHSVRYQDSYVKQDGKWLIAKRIANFMISETRMIRGDLLLMCRANYISPKIKRWDLQNLLQNHRTFTSSMTTVASNPSTLERPHTTTGSAQYATVHLFPQSTAVRLAHHND